MQEIPILFENNDLIVVNKPSGLAMHDSAERENTPSGIVSKLKAQLNQDRLYLCHRLDTGTSGCLCLAKNEKAAAEVGELFARRHVHKYYIALSNSSPRKKQGTIIGDMKNRRAGQRILLKSTKNPAITQFFSQSAKPGTRGFIVKPYSGKTHQIRVALKSIGAPIIGDALYGGQEADRLYLHAWQISLPMQTGNVSVSAPAEHCNGKLFYDKEIKQWFNKLLAPDSYPWPALPQRLVNTLVDVSSHINVASIEAH